MLLFILLKDYYPKYKNSSFNSISKKIKNKSTTQSRNGQTLSQRVHADGQQAHEKMLNMTNHQGNANKNHKEISNGYHQKEHK